MRMKRMTAANWVTLRRNMFKKGKTLSQHKFFFFNILCKHTFSTLFFKNTKYAVAFFSRYFTTNCAREFLNESQNFFGFL